MYVRGACSGMPSGCTGTLLMLKGTDGFEIGEASGGLDTVALTGCFMTG